MIPRKYRNLLKRSLKLRASTKLLLLEVVDEIFDKVDDKLFRRLIRQAISEQQMVRSDDTTARGDGDGGDDDHRQKEVSVAEVSGQQQPEFPKQTPFEEPTNSFVTVDKNNNNNEEEGKSAVLSDDSDDCDESQVDDDAKEYIQMDWQEIFAKVTQLKSLSPPSGSLSLSSASSSRSSSVSSWVSVSSTYKEEDLVYSESEDDPAATSDSTKQGGTDDSEENDSGHESSETTSSFATVSDDGSYDRKLQCFIESERGWSLGLKRKWIEESGFDEMMTAKKICVDSGSGADDDDQWGVAPNIRLVKKPPGPLYRCIMCGEVFPHWTQLRSHNLHSHKQWVCMDCGKSFNNGSALYWHQLVNRHLYY